MDRRHFILSVLSALASGSSLAAATRPRVALILKTMANPYFLAMEQGAREAANRLGLDLLVKAASQETSIEEQIQLVVDAIALPVQALVITPADSVKLVPVLKRAQDAGIAIVNADNRLDQEFSRQTGLSGVPFVSIDNVRAAHQVASVIARTATAPTDAAVIEGIRSASNAQARKIGALRAFAENPVIRIVAMESANWRAEEAYQVTRRVIGAHPRLGLLFCANDVMAMGAMRLLREQKITHVRVAGFDALPEVAPFLESGELMATLDQQAGIQGARSMEIAADLLRGQTVAMETLVDAKVVVSARH